MDNLILKNIFEVIDDYDVFLFDLWGVIIEGGYTYPNVVENINEIIKKKKVYFITNAPRSTPSLLEMLKPWGLNVSLEMIISSGELAIEMILASNRLFGIKKPMVYYLGEEKNDIINYIQDYIVNDITTANIMLMTIYRDDDTEPLNLNEFDTLLKTAIQCNTINICANPDIGIEHQGVDRYCAGYYAQRLIEFGGKVIYTGKPYAEIYNKILNQLDNPDKNRMLMIGDTFYTDILGANKIGIDSALVLTGNAEKYHKEYQQIDQKLKHLKIVAVSQGVMPSFVIKLGIAN